MKWYEKEVCKSFDYFLFCDEEIKVNNLLNDVYAKLQKNSVKNMGLLRPAEKEVFLVHLNCILSNLVYRYDTSPPGSIFYSRSQYRYRKKGRLNPIGLTLPVFCRVVDAMTNSKLIWHKESFHTKDPETSLSSRMKVGRSLLDLFKTHSFTSESVNWNVDVDPIQINTVKTNPRTKQTYKELVDYPEDGYSIKYRNEMIVYSNLLKKFTFKCYRGSNPKDIYKIPQSDFYRVKRVFRDNWRQGSRIYASHQSKIRRDDRNNITINGKKTVEWDYNNNHIKILYASFGYDYTEDAYALPGYEDPTGRDLLKFLLLSILNTDSKTSTIRAMNDKINGKKRVKTNKFSGMKETVVLDEKSRKKFKKYCETKKVDFSLLIDQFSERHHLISSNFFIKQGLTLQRIDGEIATRIIKEYVKHGKPIIPYHDSFRVLEEDSKILQDSMIKYHKDILNIDKVDRESLIDKKE